MSFFSGMLRYLLTRPGAHAGHGSVSEFRTARRASSRHGGDPNLPRLISNDTRWQNIGHRVCSGMKWLPVWLHSQFITAVSHTTVPEEELKDRCCPGN